MRDRFKQWYGCLGVGALLIAQLPVWAQESISLAHSELGMSRPADSYQAVYVEDWQGGLDARIGVQANPGDIAIVDDPVFPGGKVVRASISRNGNFSHVANGAPRAELLFPKPVSFVQGQDYLIRWSTFLPSSFEFDDKQLVIVTQIHQGTLAGPPTIALTMLGSRYAISERGGLHPERVSAAKWICCADFDRGKWVHWALRYVPDDSGKKSLTELWKDGVSVFASKGAPNSYLNDQQAYLKIGLYKSGWNSQPSDVTRIQAFFGRVDVSRRSLLPAIGGDQAQTASVRRERSEANHENHVEK
ncbi:heparin lyase I family protein [Paraburkholderia sediminicola]|uniref:Heparin lyase I family protein n=1 Tax=Paraburkholderia rhynchosiae TaxID=487049 RepID=A0ACC7NEZ3_9BURK